jgi:hypothetical protein
MRDSLANANIRITKVPGQPSEIKALPPSNVFLAILQDAKKQTQLPLLLPSELPVSYSSLSPSLVAEEDEYAIDLFTEATAGRYIAGFLAEKEEKYSAADIGNTKQVMLAKNTTGFFRPISCGGSCSPVNLCENRPEFFITFKQSCLLILPRMSRRSSSFLSPTRQFWVAPDN